MKIVFMVFLAISFIWGSSYKEIISHIVNTPAVESAKMMEKAAEEMEYSTEGMNLPSVSAELQGVWLKDTPTMILHFPNFPSSPLPMGKRRNFTGTLVMRYPIFSGFAISSKIEEAKIKSQQVHLKVLDLQRNLILKATEIYSSIRAMKKILLAEIVAKKAFEQALKKAKGMYKNGLISPSSLYAIKARGYDIDSKITDTKKIISQLKNNLSYISGMNIKSISGGVSLPRPLKIEYMISKAFEYRSDILILKKSLDISNKDIDLAKSNLYPKIGAEVAFKRQGDTLSLNGDGYTNADRSYLGVDIKWNIFNGGQDKHLIESADYKSLSYASTLIDYKNRVATEIKNAQLDLYALYSKLKSAKMEVKSQNEYYLLTKGRFANQLADADELSRSIADLAMARAKVAEVESKIDIQKAKLWLMSGLKNFKDRLR